MRYKLFGPLKNFMIAFLCTFPLSSHAYAAPLFDKNSILEIELHGPRQELIKKRKNEDDWLFRLVSDEGAQNVQIRARGNSRLRICKLPPLRIEFNGVDNQNTNFAGLQKLKLVLPCRRGETAQSDVVQEYLAYRIFNRISDYGYRVRLLRMKFVDVEEQNASDAEVSIGFAIEPRQTFADRVGGEPVDAPGVSLTSLNRQHMAKVYVFQYLIGNTDWSLVTAEGDEFCCHNGEIFDINREGYYVPYDFDLSGIVNANYAYPDALLRIKKVTQRLYRGFCTPRNELQTALAAIKAEQSEIFQELDALPGMSEKEEEKTKKFIDEFFEETGDEQKLLDSFERRCL